jgi:hypothetical protein
VTIEIEHIEDQVADRISLGEAAYPVGVGDVNLLMELAAARTARFVEGHDHAVEHGCRHTELLTDLAAQLSVAVGDLHVVTGHDSDPASLDC